MPTADHPRFALEIPSHGDTAPREHRENWLRHVTSGAIPSDPQTTPAQLLTHLRNEEVLLGKSRSLTFATPAPYKGRR